MEEKTTSEKRDASHFVSILPPAKLFGAFKITSGRDGWLVFRQREKRLELRKQKRLESIQ